MPLFENFELILTDLTYGFSLGLVVSMGLSGVVCVWVVVVEVVVEVVEVVVEVEELVEVVVVETVDVVVLDCLVIEVMRLTVGISGEHGISIGGVSTSFTKSSNCFILAMLGGNGGFTWS